MVRTRLFKNTFILLVLVAMLDLVGIYLYLYWTVWWFDMVTHFLAGGVVGLATLLAWQKFSIIKDEKMSKIIWSAIIAGLIVGLLWEGFELYFDLTSFSDGVVYVTDTVSDLILDTVGAFLGVLYGMKINK